MITLTIEDTEVKIAVAQGKTIKSAITIPLPSGMVKNGVVTDATAMGALIRDNLRTKGIAEKQVIASVSGIHTFYRVVRLPQLPSSVLEEAVRHEMEKAIPVPLAEMYTSWQISPLNHEQVVLSMVGIPRDNIDTVLDAIHHAGLACQIMDLKPLALARVIDAAQCIVIDIQQQSFDIVIVIDGIPEIVRSLSFVGEDVSSRDRITEVSAELERTVAFYNSSQESVTIDHTTPLFISGDFHTLVTEKSTINSGGLGYPVRELPQLLEYSDGINADEFVVNTGLASKQIKNSTSLLRVNMNVIPMAYQPRKVPVMQVFIWIFIIAAIAILIFAGINIQRSVARTAELQNQLDTAQKQISSLKTTQEELQKFQASLAKAKVDRDVVRKLLDTITAQRNKVNSDMGKVTGSLSGLIKPSNITYSGGYTINGVAANPEAIFSYVQILKSSGSFADVTISSMQEKTINEWEFSVSMQ